MTGFLTQLRSAAAKRAAYTRTVREIKNMPLSVAIDLGIYPPDARKIASEAVYGNGNRVL